jgi:hypothetical protein
LIRGALGLDLAAWNGLGLMIYSVNDDENPWKSWVGQLRSCFPWMDCHTAEDTPGNEKQQVGEICLAEGFSSLIAIVQRLY